MKILHRVIICFAFAALLSSCTVSKHNNHNPTNYGGFARQQGDMAGIEIKHDQYADGRLFESEAPTPALDTQKIVYTAYLDLTVKNTDTVSKQIVQLIKNSTGYVQTANNDYLVIKVPQKGLNDIIIAVETMGKVTYKNIGADDITDSYYDAATRLDNLNKTRLRYLDLLNKAQTVEEMLKVEKELERINGEIELLKARLARMDNNVQYSTITISLNEKIKPGILSYPFIWLYKGVSWLFVRN